MKTGHKAALDTCRELERQGFEVTYLDVGADGLLDLDTLRAALRDDTILVSVMMVNNKTGVIQPVAEIGAMCRARGIVFHCDAVQAAGKIAIDVNALGVDLLAVTAHKLYGPKGIGALYVRRKPRVHIEAQMHGGGHERGMRSGTLPTHQIIGMGEAEVDEVIGPVTETVAKLRALSPLWDMHLEGVDLETIQWAAH